MQTQKKQVRLSLSAVKTASERGAEFLDAYLFVCTLHTYVKHPIILNYKSQIPNVRKLIGMSDYLFRKKVNKSIENGLAYFEGDHLRFLSNNRNFTEFKKSKRNDHYVTREPKLFAQMAMVKKHYQKQLSQIKKKIRQTEKIVDKGVGSRLNNVNSFITLSARSAKKVFNVRSTSTAHKRIKSLEKRGLITTYVKTKMLTPKEAAISLSAGDRNIRKIEGSLYRCQWYTKLNYEFKRVKFYPWMNLPERILNSYLEMGYSYQDIDRLIVTSR